MEPIYWVFLWLVCLCGASARSDYLTYASGMEFTFDDEAEGSATEGSAAAAAEPAHHICSPCQCQCQSSPVNTDSRGVTEVSHIKKQLRNILVDLNSQDKSFDNIMKELSFVQHYFYSESLRDSHCPDDFIHDRQANMCFQLNLDMMTWAEAQQYCQHLGPKTQLATLDTPEKLKIVREHLKARKDSMPRLPYSYSDIVWLGGMQTQNEGTWFWTVNGRPLDDEDGQLWRPGNPVKKVGRYENCLSLYYGAPFSYWSFDDIGCHHQGMYICERLMADGDSNVSDGSAPHCTPCQCQHPLVDTQPNASSHVQKQLSIIQEQLNRQSESFDDMKKHIDSIGQHDLESAEVTESPGNSSESTRSYLCPEDFVYDRQTNLCFQLKPLKARESLSWAQAQRYCQYIGPKTHLATLDTHEKMDVVKRYLELEDSESRLPYRLGSTVWLGALRSQEGQWFWTLTGQPLSDQEDVAGIPGMTFRKTDRYDTEICLTLYQKGPRSPWYLFHNKCENRGMSICERLMD